MMNKYNPLDHIDPDQLDEIILSTVLGKHRDMVKEISSDMRFALDLERSKLIERYEEKGEKNK